MDSIGKAAALVAAASRHTPANRPASDDRPTSLKPALVDKECDYDLPARLFMPWIPDNAPREIRRALTEAERAQLSARAVALQDGLRPFVRSEEGRVNAAIAAMLGGFRAMRQQGDDVVAMVDVTRAVLRDFPVWAIEKACVAIAQRDTDPPLDPAYAPNDAQIFEIVRKIVEPYRKIRATVEAVLNAPVALPAPPKPQDSTAAEAIAARCSSQPKYQPPERGDGKHAERVAAELAARRARRETQGSTQAA